MPIERKKAIAGWKPEAVHGAAWPAARMVHINDRESDIYKLSCTPQHADTNFLLRTCVDRLAGGGDYTIADEIREVPVQGLHRVEVRNKKGEISEAVLELRYRRIRVLPPIGKQKLYPELMLNMLRNRTNHTERTGQNRLEADHQPSRVVAQGGGRKAALVCDALEDRDLP